MLTIANQGNLLMSKFTRRSFVGQSLAAAGAISAAPGILRAQGANDKIGMAVVGCGGRGGSWRAQQRGAEGDTWPFF